MALELQDREVDEVEDQDGDADDWYAVASREAQDCHTEIAFACWPHGARLVCPVCGREQNASPKQLSRFLASVFPTCHGKTMQLADMGEQSNG